MNEIKGSEKVDGYMTEAVGGIKSNAEQKSNLFSHRYNKDRTNYAEADKWVGGKGQKFTGRLYQVSHTKAGCKVL